MTKLCAFHMGPVNIYSLLNILLCHYVWFLGVSVKKKKKLVRSVDSAYQVYGHTVNIAKCATRASLENFKK